MSHSMKKDSAQNTDNKPTSDPSGCQRNVGKVICKTCSDKLLLLGAPYSDPTGQILLIHLMGGHQVEIQEPVQPSLNVAVSNILDTNRQRKDYGDVASLMASIRQFGIIQPIVLYRPPSGGQDVLIAGGRRLAALRNLGVQELRHGKEFIWREEVESSDGRLRLQAVELEENLRRKDLSWPEHIAAKLRLFDLMQSIHGVSKGFGGGRSGTLDGFSLRKLASMLGENPSITSRDLELARFVEKHPALAKMPTKSDAQRKLGVAMTVASMQMLAKTSTLPTNGESRTALPEAGPGQIAAGGSVVGTGADRTANPDSSISAPAPAEEKWRLYEGRFQDNIENVASASVDLICTDLPYNIGLGDSSAAHSAGLGGFDDSQLDITQLCCDVAVESFRVMRDNRFGVFFYGMAYHQLFVDALESAGFTVDPYPFIWIRDRTAPPDGFARYSKTYDPALIVSKGTPRFVRPNLPNSCAIPSVRGPERLHAAQKPLGIMQKFIEDMTVPGCVVLDMFAGAGTTGEAALRCGRKAILFELETNNCLLIRSRLGAIR